MNNKNASPERIHHPKDIKAELIECHNGGFTVSASLIRRTMMCISQLEAVAMSTPPVSATAEEAYDDFASNYDHESDEWLDMAVDRFFCEGFKRGLSALTAAQLEGARKMQAAAAKEMAPMYGTKTAQKILTWAQNAIRALKPEDVIKGE